MTKLSNSSKNVPTSEASTPHPSGADMKSLVVVPSGSPSGSHPARHQTVTGITRVPRVITSSMNPSLYEVTQGNFEGVPNTHSLKEAHRGTSKMKPPRKAKSSKEAGDDTTLRADQQRALHAVRHDLEALTITENFCRYKELPNRHWGGLQLERHPNDTEKLILLIYTKPQLQLPLAERTVAIRSNEADEGMQHYSSPEEVKLKRINPSPLQGMECFGAQLPRKNIQLKLTAK